MTTTTDTTPAIWVGCLSCYNAGYLIGEWVALDNDRDMNGQAIDDIIEAHTPPADNAYSACEEWLAFDHEGFTMSGESIMEALDIVETLNAWVDYFPGVPSAVLSQAIDDLDAADPEYVYYYGEHDSWAGVAEERVDSGVFGVIPDELLRYFDYAAYGRDMSMSGYEIRHNGSGYYWEAC